MTGTSQDQVVRCIIMYVVFDMSPLDEANKGYLQVGLGPIAAADFKPRYKYSKKYDEY